MKKTLSAWTVALVAVVIGGLSLVGSSERTADASTAASPWGTAIDIPGLAALGGTDSWLTQVACTSPGNCTAGGSFAKGSSIHPLFVDQVNGVWGNAYEVPGSWAFDPDDIDRRIDQLACASDGGCVAAGHYETGRGRRTFLVRRIGGVWTDAEPMPNASELAGAGDVGQYFLSGASCSSSGNCSVAGFYFGGTTPQGGYLVDLSGGVWQDAIDVPGLVALSTGGSSYLTSVSCPTAGQCSATGTYNATTGAHAFVVDQSNGAWGTATDVPGLSMLSTADAADSLTISCSSTGNCSVGGHYAVRNLVDPSVLEWYPFVADRIDGQWSDAHPLTLAGVVVSSVSVMSCPTDGNCSAIGRFHVPGDPVADHDSLFVLQRIGGVWGAPVPMPGMAALNTANGAMVESISCAAPGACAATGHFTDATGEVPFVADSAGWVWNAPIAVPGVHGPSIGECTYAVWGDACPTGRSVSCSSTISCVVVGDTYPNGKGRAFLVDYFDPPAPTPEPAPEPPAPAPPVFTG